MEILSWDRGEEWGESAFLEVIPFVAYLLSTERTAWWNTLVRTYSGPTDLYTTFKSAATVAQSQRLQGSSFTIEEVPSLAFASQEGMIIASEFGHSNPFSEINLERLESSLIIGSRMGSLQLLTKVDSIFIWRSGKRTDYTYTQGFAPMESILESIADKSKFRSWRSNPRSVDHLDWGLEENNRGVDGLLAIREAYEVQNKEATREFAHNYLTGLSDDRFDQAIALEVKWHEGFAAAKSIYKVDENAKDGE